MDDDAGVWSDAGGCSGGVTFREHAGVGRTGASDGQSEHRAAVGTYVREE